MKGELLISMRPALIIVVFFFLLSEVTAANAQPGENSKRGEYLVKTANCIGCHTEERDGAIPYAGGRALKTPFGTFFGPNITQDKDAGIGRWSEADFIRAMRSGMRPDSAAYFPAFPYPSYTKITDTDLKDMWSYLRTLAPNNQGNRPHDLGFFFQWRFLVRFWKLLFFTSGPFVNDSGRSPVLNRGAYLVQAVGHCGECHTPRNFLGAPKISRFLAGGMAPDGKRVPNLTPTRLKRWSDQELHDYLTTGIMPDGDVANKTMSEVIQNSTRGLTPEDMVAMIAYMRSLPPLEDDLK